jgi:hypothetical protein
LTKVVPCIMHHYDKIFCLLVGTMAVLRKWLVDKLSQCNIYTNFVAVSICIDGRWNVIEE